MRDLHLSPNTAGPQEERPGRPWVGAALAVAAPLAIVYASVFVSAALARPLSDLGGPGYTLLRFATSLALCLGPLALWPFRLRSFAVTAGLGLTALALLNLVHVFEYSELVTVGAIDAVMNTTGRETGEFLRSRQTSLLLAAFASGAAAVSVAWAARSVPRGARTTRRMRAVAAGLGAAGLAVLALYPMRLFPVSTVKNAADYALYQRHVRAAREARAAHRFGVSAAAGWRQPPVLVLVLGESLRRDHLGLYGYDRDTTPLLSALDSLVVFEDAVTAAPVTQPAVQMMMTGATPATVSAHVEGSWLALAREAGYGTAWISNQDRTDGSETALLAEDAEESVYANHSWSASAQYDEDVLPEIDRVLAARGGALALVVHLMGSHDDYSLRYPAHFGRFTAADPAPALHPGLDADERALVDHYDNSVRYTDWVVAETIRRVEATGAPALVAFVSDHGENLYDTPRRMRGHGVPGTTRFEAEVPLAVWTSPALRAERPDLAAALARNRRQPVSTADLFDSFADLLSTDWAGLRPERSLFRAGYRPVPRQILVPTGEAVPVESLGGAALAGRP